MFTLKEIKSNIKIEVFASEENVTSKDLIEFEKQIQITLPLDYKNIVINCNGLKPKQCYYITIDGTIPLIEFSEIIPLKYLSSRLKFYREFEILNKSTVLNNYLPIGDTVGQGKIFLGTNENNLNQVFYFDPRDSNEFENDKTFIATNIIEFFNENLMPEDKADIWISQNM